MRHLITIAFFLAALAAYLPAPLLTGALWLAGALLAAGIVSEGVFWFRVLTRKKPPTHA
jgi:hypothetical protein